MTAITEADYQRLSWHQRHRLNERLAAETRQLQAQARARTQARRAAARVVAVARENAAHMTECNRILAGLPVDPDALAHQEHADTAYRPRVAS